MPPPTLLAVLPLTVELVNVNVLRLRMPPPKLLKPEFVVPVPLPFVIVTPFIVRFALGFRKNTRLVLLPEINRLLAPVELVIVNVPAVAAELMASSPSVNVIVQTPDVQPALPAGITKLIVSFVAAAFAALTASLKLQSTPETQVVLRLSVRVTVNVNCACTLCAANRQIKNVNAAIKPEARNVDDGKNARGVVVKSDIN